MKKDDRAARAVADVTAGTILAQVDISAPVERVFAALTRGDEIIKWWGSDDLYRTTAPTAPGRRLVSARTARPSRSAENTSWSSRRTA